MLSMSAEEEKVLEEKKTPVPVKQPASGPPKLVAPLSRALFKLFQELERENPGELKDVVLESDTQLLNKNNLSEPSEEQCCSCVLL